MDTEYGYYNISDVDEEFLTEITGLLWKMARAPFITARQLAVIGHMLTAIECLPKSLDQFVGIAQLGGPVFRNGKNYSYICHDVHIDETQICLVVYEIRNMGYGADTYHDFSWHISVEQSNKGHGYLLDVECYIDSEGNLVNNRLDWAPEDLEHLKCYVESSDLADGEYSLEVHGGEGLFECDCYSRTSS